MQVLISLWMIAQAAQSVSTVWTSMTIQSRELTTRDPEAGLPVLMSASPWVQVIKFPKSSSKVHTHCCFICLHLQLGRSTTASKRLEYFLSDNMASAVAVPEHKLFESPNSRSIEINDWIVTAETNPISGAAELDAIQSVTGMPLPEMTFGSNSLTLEHRSSGWVHSFNAQDALSMVKKGELGPGDGAVRVGYAEAWLQSRYEECTSLFFSSYLICAQHRAHSTPTNARDSTDEAL
jgi:hypothetical protein